MILTDCEAALVLGWMAIVSACVPESVRPQRSIGGNSNGESILLPLLVAMSGDTLRAHAASGCLAFARRYPAQPRRILSELALVFTGDGQI